MLNDGDSEVIQGISVKSILITSSSIVGESRVQLKLQVISQYASDSCSLQPTPIASQLPKVAIQGGRLVILLNFY